MLHFDNFEVISREWIKSSDDRYYMYVTEIHTWQVRCPSKDLATEQTISRMINLLRQLQQILPPSTLASTWSSLKPQRQCIIVNSFILAHKRMTFFSYRSKDRFQLHLMQ